MSIDQSPQLSRRLSEAIRAAWFSVILPRRLNFIRMHDCKETEEISRVFIWYGNAKKSHQYFLYYLIKLGCDVLVFNPSGTDPLSIMDHEQQLTFVHKFPEYTEPEPFPTEKRSRKAKGHPGDLPGTQESLHDRG